jgi:hypothetical protein
MRRGVNRPEIEALLREAVIRLTGIASDNVFFSEHAVDTVAPVRPCVSMTLMPYETLQRPGHEFRVLSLEHWRLEITEANDADYEIDIDGTTYSTTAVGLTATEIRDALLAEINSGPHPTFAATGPASISIDIKSLVAGYRLRVENPSIDISVSQLRGNVLKQVVADVSLRLEVECVGSFTSSMAAELTGVDIAERLANALRDIDDTAAMRAANHHITLTRVTDRRQIVNGQEETIGVIDCVLATTTTHITTIGDARSASATMTA